MMTLVVEWWIETFAHMNGLNLYEDGANHAMANMLFYCMEGFWSAAFRRKLLLHFQRMFRSRTRARYQECKTFEEKEKILVFGNQNELLRYFSLSFTALGHRHVVELPERVLDIALIGLVQLGHIWNERFDGPWEVVHDQSSKMAKQKWIWDIYSSATMATARFEHPGIVAQFPMNVTKTRFAIQPKNTTSNLR